MRVERSRVGCKQSCLVVVETPVFAITVKETLIGRINCQDGLPRMVEHSKDYVLLQVARAILSSFVIEGGRAVVHSGLMVVVPHYPHGLIFYLEQNSPMYWVPYI